ncbi:MAG: GNAT family N-acetyltransferase [Pseudomonadota bacterium]
MVTQLKVEDLTLETDRLILTPMSENDIDIATKVLCDERVMRYVADTMTPEGVQAHMKDAAKRGAGGRIGIWLITRKDTGEKIGDAVLMPVPIEEDDYDWSLLVPDGYPNADIEVGYLLVPDAWGQGFATEACRRMVQFAFEATALDEVVACADADNAKSHHVLQKSGLRRSGVKRVYAEDDVPWFVLTRAAWEAVGETRP